MTPLAELNIAGLRIIDGGMATELEHRGCDITGALWSAHALDSSPRIIEAVHGSYLEAGADCILTASYQVSNKGYAELGLDTEKVAEDLRRSVDLAEAARSQIAGRRIWIGASLGPYGAALHNGAEYHGNYDCSFDDLIDFHVRRLAVLAETAADFIAFETIPSLTEAHAILAALHCYPHIGAWISFTCRDSQHTAHGEQIADCAAQLDSAPQVIAIGINCTAPSLVASLIRKVRSISEKAIVIYPNSGENWDAERRCWTGNSDPADFAALALEWRALGVQAIGGCCRTTPEHIRRIALALQ
jgi:homocysteine S-methyltransferase